MAQSCPLAFRQIDGTLTRLNALSVFLLLLLFLVVPSPLILLFVGLDFIIRLYGNKRFSPVFRLSKILKKIFGLRSEMTDAGAKRLAAHFGLFFAMAALASSLAGFALLMYLTVAIFLFCLALELLFAYCIGCKIYFIYRKFVPERL
ncbi:MAG: DUF4395 domain-containing protein [Thiovulaceae bacterium]|nr:DUF4395 domain-containing protein [Sulfurimonadaceae bacterium]